MRTLLNRLKKWRQVTLLGLLVAATGQLAEQRMTRAAEVVQAPAETPLNAGHAASCNLPAQAQPIYSTFTTSAIDPQFDPVYASAGQPGKLPSGVRSGPAPVGPDR